jgi:signal transduction histidine kinase
VSIGRRLTLAFGSVALIIACGAAVASWQFHNILQETRMLAAADDKMLAVYRVRADVGAIRRRLDELSNVHDAARFAPSAHRLRQELFEDIDQALRYFHETGTPVPGTLGALRDAIGDQFDAMQRLNEVNDWTAVRLRLDNQVNAILDGVREMVEHVNSDVTEQRIRSVREIEAGQQRAQLILALTALASLTIALSLGLSVTRGIVAPLSQLKAAAHQFAAGDFDITLRIGSKDELGDVGQAFVIAARKLHDSYATLRRSNEDLEQFAYAASHDLQEPLRTMSTFSQLLKERHGSSLTAEGKEYLAYVVDASARMRELIAGILEYSRLVSSENQQGEAVSSEDVVGIVLQNLQATIKQTGAVITYDKLPCVLGSRLQLTQLFQNLVGNAIKYRREDAPPRIHIFAREDNGMWQFCCEDNGMGIDARYQSHIFGMFKQLDRGGKGGVGMGLAIAKRIVERHGGTISVTSTVGKGSCFYFTLPRLEKDVAAVGCAAGSLAGKPVA